MFASSRLGFVTAFVLALCLLQAVPAVSAQSDCPSTSPAFGDQFMAAQDALEAKRWSDVIANAQKVLAASNRKPDDTYAANYFLMEAHRALGNIAEARAAQKGMLDSGFPISPGTRAWIDRALQ